MNSTQIEQYLTAQEIAFTPEERKEYRFQMETQPGCRFRHCSARLSMRDEGAGLRLTAELPIFVNRKEFSGVGAQLADLNESMTCSLGALSMDGALHISEGFTLDVINSAVRYEIDAWSNSPDDVGPQQLRQILDEIAGSSIGKYSEEIMRMVSRESIRIEREERRELAEWAAKSRTKSPMQRLLELIGLDAPNYEEYAEDAEQE